MSDCGFWHDALATQLGFWWGIATYWFVNYKPKAVPVTQADDSATIAAREESRAVQPPAPPRDGHGAAIKTTIGCADGFHYMCEHAIPSRIEVPQTGDLTGRDG